MKQRSVQTLELILVLSIKPSVDHENTFVAITIFLASADAARREILR